MYPRYASLVIAAFAATLTACGSDTTTNVLPGAEPVVSAPDYAVTLADGTIQLTVGEVKAFTVSARVKKSRTVRWSSSNTTVATVSSNGTVTAKTVGTALVTATASNGAVDRFSTAVVSGTTTVASAAKVASVQVSAPATTMTLGASQTATATARDSAGTVLTGRTVTWSVSAGTSLMVNASGVVTALAGGTESVVATIDGVKGAQAITVATVTSVAVSPKTGTALAPAQTRQFTTVATWSDQVTRPVSITYTATGGTISTSGLYTAGQLAGTFLVIANCACGRADTAAVSIVLPAQLTSLSISPKIATVNAGATQQFSAVANWSTGATTLPPITYSATGGVVSTTGLWTAPSTAGTYKVIVAHTGGTLKDTASVTVQVATTTAPTTTALRANEPAGYTMLSDNPMNGTQTGLKWWLHQRTAGDLVPDTTTSGPFSPGSSYRFLYKTGLTFGSQPGGQMGFTAPSTTGYRGWYESGTIQIGVTSFETQLVGVKALGYWGVGGTSAKPSVEFYNIIEGNQSSTSVMTSWKIWFGQQGPGPVSRRIDMNMNTSKRMLAGTWHRYEMLATANTMGMANGTFKFWIDGVQVFDYKDMVWITESNPVMFYGRKIDPIWGGGGGAPRSRDDYIWWDHVYVSVIP